MTHNYITFNKKLSIKIRAYNYIISFLWVICILCSSCGNDDSPDDIPGDSNRTSGGNGPVSPPSTERAYVGLGELPGFGRDGPQNTEVLYKFDPSTNTWRETAKFPLSRFTQGVAFAVGGKGYVGTGRAGRPGSGVTNKFWCYDPKSDAWSEVNMDSSISEQLVPRFNALAFAVGEKGYVGTGGTPSGGNLNDFYSYDPSTDTWSVLKGSQEYPGRRRSHSVAFVIDDEKGQGQAYMGLGVEGTTTLTDFWRFQPDFGWSELRNVPIEAELTYEAVAFVIEGKGYVGTEKVRTAETYQFHRYDPVTNTWKLLRENFPGAPKSHALAFAVGGKGYVGLGNTERGDDFYSYNASNGTWEALQVEGNIFNGGQRRDAVAFVLN